jgi:hypothetical protein
MRSFKISLSVILMFFCTEIWAQGFVENALLFSRTKPGGSARIQAMGGAQVALGGDFSSALSNPAGLGMYNRSEFTFSPALNFYTSDSQHLGNGMTDSKSVFNIPGLSYVHHSPRDNGEFLGGSFAISMSRINDFHNTFQYGAADNATSIIDYFEQKAQGYSIDPLASPYDDTPLLNYDAPEGLAYLTYLITPYNEDPDNASPVLPDDYVNYFSELDTFGTTEVRSLKRQGRVNVRGAQYQWSFAYGGNIQDKFFFGASLGLTTLRYKFSSSYSESDYTFSSPYVSPLDDMRLDETIEIDGSGVNLTVGFIYRFVDFAQVGVSLVTPTYYVLTDTYSARLRANWDQSVLIPLGDNRADQDESSNPIVSEYNIVTPTKISTGLAFFLGKYGLVSGDVEFVNYGKAKYNSNTPGVSFKPDNDDIKYYYKNVVNYRIGAEGRLDVFRLRAGYNIQNNPYKRNFNAGGNITTLSAGVGVKLQKFFVDATWLSLRYNSSYSPYSVEDEDGDLVGPTARLKNTINSAMLTVGFSF